MSTDPERGRAISHEHDVHIEHILNTLAELAAHADRRATAYWEAKDHLDAYLQEILNMPKRDRPTGEQMATVVGRDRRRLYQIRNLDLTKDPGKSVPRRPA